MININIKAPLNGYLGYGHAGINIVKALDKIGSKISLMPVGPDVSLTTNDQELFQRLLNSRFELFDIYAHSLTIFHEFTFFESLPSKRETIGFPFFELDEMTLMKRKSLSCVDRLFVSSEWAKQVVIGAKFKGSVDVVPLGVDQTIFSPPPANRQPDKDDTYKFFTIGKIEKRKSTNILHKIFNAAFDENDDVELHVMCDSPLPQIKAQMPHYRDMYKGTALGDKIFIHQLKSTDYELARFIQDMDCGIYMTRAEGWGLPILQSMSCGKPIIVTDYSAQAEFCNEKNANLVNIDELEPAHDGVWFDGKQGSWARIDEKQVDQCIEHMRSLYKNRVRYNEEGVKTGEKLSWENTAVKILGNLE